MSDYNLPVSHIPDGHTLVGYVAYLHMLDSKGQPYWASRRSGVSDMEAVGMADSLHQVYVRDVLDTTRPVDPDH